MPKQARLSGIKQYRSYTIEEVSGITGVSIRTVHNWSKIGLRVMDGVRPALIRGDELSKFLKAQRESAKVKTKIDQFYCMSCRAPRSAAGGFADCNISGTRVSMTAFCSTCETVVTKLISERSIPEIEQSLDLTIKRLEATL